MSKEYTVLDILELFKNGDEQTKAIIEASLRPTAKEIIEVIGADKAFLLLEKIGGVDFFVPKGEVARKTKGNRPEREQRLIDVLGYEVAQTFMQAFGGSRLYLPNCKEVKTALKHRDIAGVIRATVSDYCSAKEASEKYCGEYKVSDRQVRTVMSKEGVKPNMFRYVDERQMDLFSE